MGNDLDYQTVRFALTVSHSSKLIITVTTSKLKETLASQHFSPKILVKIKMKSNTKEYWEGMKTLIVC